MSIHQERDSQSNNHEDNKSRKDPVNKEEILSEVNKTDNANNVGSNNKEMENFEVGHQKDSPRDEKNLENSGDGNKKNEDEQEIPWFKECINKISEPKENVQNQALTSSSDELNNKPITQDPSKIEQLEGHIIKTTKKLNEKQTKKGKKKIDKENFELMDFLSSSTKMYISRTKLYYIFKKYNMNKYKNKELNQLNFESIANICNNYDHLMNEDKNDELNESDFGAIANICTNHDHHMNEDFGGITIFTNHCHLMNENENEEENKFDFESMSNICTNHDHLYNNLRNRGFWMTNETTILPHLFHVHYNALTDSTNYTTIKNVYN